MSDAKLQAARERSLVGALTDAHVLVTTGAGGVGKTTTAAALGLAAAAAGRRTLVLTIDPAKRLAQSLGLERLGDTPTRIPLADGELWAMMLDMQSTFDHLIDRHAGSTRRAEAIRNNRIYQTMSSTLSGTQEYMAMEKLHELHDDGEWDLLVIDTPPTRSALDFLDAPNRMTSFLEGRLLKLLLKPGMAAGGGILKIVGFGATQFMKIAGRVMGVELLEDLATFFREFEVMYDGFKERAAQVLELLREPSSQFVVVAAPQPPPLREARYFLERLEKEGLHCAGAVVNRVHARSITDPARLRKAADTVDDKPLAKALRLMAATSDLADRERHDVNAALYGLVPHALIEVPLLKSDVHDVATLKAIVASLIGEPAVA